MKNIKSLVLAFITLTVVLIAGCGGGGGETGSPGPMPTVTGTPVYDGAIDLTASGYYSNCFTFKRSRLDNVTDYTIMRKKTDASSWEVSGILKTNPNGFYVYLEPHQYLDPSSYEYRVDTITSDGRSIVSPSLPIQFVGYKDLGVLSGLFSAISIDIDPANLSGPQNTAAAQGLPNSLVFERAPEDTVVSYRVSRSPNGIDNWVDIAEIPAGHLDEKGKPVLESNFVFMEPDENLTVGKYHYCVSAEHWLDGQVPPNVLVPGEVIELEYTGYGSTTP